METTVKNSELLIISEQLSKLESENVTLGVKSRIQKIIRSLNDHFEVYNPLFIKLLEKYGAEKDEQGFLSLKFSNGDSKQEEYKTDYEELNVFNTITFDPIDFLKIQDISTTNKYNFDLLKRFFENY